MTIIYNEEQVWCSLNNTYSDFFKYSKIFFAQNNSKNFTLNIVLRPDTVSNNIYLNININKTSKAKNVATLSIVRSITTSCRRRAGKKRTNFSILRRRNVLNTDKPLSPSCCSNSIILW
jgi:hypothetical protein